VGVAAFVGLVLCAVIVIGFVIYGMFLGLSTLAALVGRLWMRVVALDTGVGTLAAREDSFLDRPDQSRPERLCWEIHGCSSEAREDCPAYQHPELPCWLAKMQATPELRLKPDCLACRLFNIPALMTGA